MPTATPPPDATAALPFKVVGDSALFRAAWARIARIARSDAPVLVEGETGSGKEVAARAIHYGGPRREAPFVPLNCGALPDTLFESELFGHERGAFTDARERRAGLVREAEGGTLFLDEVDALSARAQVALLRFLQDCRFRPLGGRECSADVRLVAASNRPLEPLVRAGAFRQDLLYRLKVLHVALPPLRARGSDACLLADHFAERFARKYGLVHVPFGATRQRWIAAQGWPGNIRELENWVHRQVLMGEAGEAADVADAAEAGDGGAIGADTAAVRGAVAAATAPQPVPGGDAPPLPRYQQAKAEALEAFEREFLLRALREAGGCVSSAAQLVGKERRAFGKLLKKYAIDRRVAAG